MIISKRRSSFFIWLSFIIIFSPLLIYLFIPKFLGDEQQYSTFKDIEVAEQKIGEIKTPVMPERYEIKKITYDHDGYTHPVTKVFYEKGNHTITFMFASSWYDDYPSQKLENDQMSEMVWISKDKKYILKWRNSKKDSYKYLFTRNEEDKEWLISIAENY